MSSEIKSGKQADVAQVVAHLIGNEEVTGPSPVISFLTRLSEKSEGLLNYNEALRCNGFVAGPNSAGSFYVLSYYSLL